MAPAIPTSALRCVLVANRGEIAVRIIGTVAALGLRSVAVYSDADADAVHVARADTALRIGAGPAERSYLDGDAIIAAALRSGADAVHPGYGFLSERAAFARSVIAAGLTWIGPPPGAIEVMGDKIAAKRMVAEAGVAVVPGRDEAGLDDDQLVAAALDIGLPVILKPSAGGGGRGLRVVERRTDLAAQVAAARAAAAAAFGDDTILVERSLSRPRHIEVQILADESGHIVHLGERECSLQRRHQKLVEEAPSPLLDDATRDRLGASAVDVARTCGYVGAGTVEFIVSADRPGEYFFMEMNTRLQVEHPVTEAVWGLDLVAWQIRIAAGEALPWSQEQLRARGHAIEARIYAEDATRGFLPVTGTVLAYREPSGEGIRVDSGVQAGTVIGTHYDPLMAKVIAWGRDRDQSRRRLVRALGDTVVLGVTTNADLLTRLLDDGDVVAGRLDTALVERVVARAADHDEAGGPDRAGEGDAAVAAAMAWALDVEPGRGGVADPWDLPGGWRVGRPAATRLDLLVDGRAIEVSVTGRAGGAIVSLAGGAPRQVSGRWIAGGEPLALSVEGRTTFWTVGGDATDRFVGRGARSWRVTRKAAGAPAAGDSGFGGPVFSPMPGTVLSVAVVRGDEVDAGTTLMVLEAMKMEHPIVARAPGVVGEVRVRPGQAVSVGETLAVFERSAGGSP